MIRITQLRLLFIRDEAEDALKGRLLKKAAQILGTGSSQIKEIMIKKRSIDARKKGEVYLTFTVDVAVSHSERILKRCKNANVSAAVNILYSPVRGQGRGEQIHIAGAGPAGLFAAYILAKNGYVPVVLERGRDVDSRQKDVERYWESGVLDPESNVQFGEGGAGTFSDGKLNTGIKDRSGRIDFVSSTFVRFGASPDILTDAAPHIGTDVLRSVIRNMRLEIIRLGGIFRFENKLSGIETEGGRLCAVYTGSGKREEAHSLILAIGHSARDTFLMLEESGITMEFKPFAVGYRVVHPQALINRALYGDRFADALGAAPYKITENGGERPVYSFCMCPGGFVVDSSSEEGRLCVNGMSYSRRDSDFANSAIVIATDKTDCLGELISDETAKKSGLCEGLTAAEPLLGVYFQRLLEERAYRAAGGLIPVQAFSDFVSGALPGSGGLTGSGSYGNNFTRGRYREASLSGILPAVHEASFIRAMESFDKRIPGFAGADCLMAGVESRTSSPLRIPRDEGGESSIRGIYPCGEGAGYAGGIVSAAVDGIRAAEAVISGSGS